MDNNFIKLFVSDIQHRRTWSAFKAVYDCINVHRNISLESLHQLVKILEETDPDNCKAKCKIAKSFFVPYIFPGGDEDER